MLDVALDTFVLGALIGAALAIRHLGRKPVPIPAALLHGVFVIATLTLGHVLPTLLKYRQPWDIILFQPMTQHPLKI
ncbi:hypothetical protein HRbin11_02483 [bacterium HR11]|nr:hypothetical protein HRbin11_02483 [bacterium HR11]